MNWTQVKTNWGQVRLRMHLRWAKLTNEDLDAIEGDRDKLVAHLRVRYAVDGTKAEREADAFIRNIQ